MKLLKITIVAVVAFIHGITYAQNNELKELIKKSFTFNTKV